MTQAYFNESQKLTRFKRIPWSWKAQDVMREILCEKGYYINCVTRIGCDRHAHDAWQVQREDVPRLVEQLFRQRIAVEVQAEGHGKASINFVYDYHEDSIIGACHRFHKNKKGDDV